MQNVEIKKQKRRTIFVKTMQPPFLHQHREHKSKYRAS